MLHTKTWRKGLRWTQNARRMHIRTSDPKQGVRLITLDRPKALNALSSELFAELNAAFEECDKDDRIRSVVLTGSERTFAAGADIKEMQATSFDQAFGKDFLKSWTAITSLSKPVLAAVHGYALGGGCELAMMADIIYAAEGAVFGQPEIKLGVIPGSGGTQRLTRAIGKAKAMDLILTGRNMSAEEALQAGLVAHVFPKEKLLPETLDAAAMIASYGMLSVKAAKEAVNAAYETSLSQGVLFERRLFHSLFATADQKEGMAAFVAKRPPKF